MFSFSEHLGSVYTTSESTSVLVCTPKSTSAQVVSLKYATQLSVSQTKTWERVEVAVDPALRSKGSSDIVHDTMKNIAPTAARCGSVPESASI